MATTQCPTCKRFGSSKLGGYCKTHYTGEVKDDKPSVKKDAPTKHIMDDFYGKPGQTGEFFPGKFGIISDTFGIEEK